MVDEVERPLPPVHQLVLLLVAVPDLVGDHLKLEILPKDCPEHAFINDIHNENKEEFEDDLLSNSTRNSNAGEPENVVSKNLSEIIDFVENHPLDPSSFNNEITIICTPPNAR